MCWLSRVRPATGRPRPRDCQRIMTDRPIAFDLTRLVTRLRHASPSGIDRVDLAYARAYLGRPRRRASASSPRRSDRASSTARRRWRSSRPWRPAGSRDRDAASDPVYRRLASRCGDPRRRAAPHPHRRVRRPAADPGAQDRRHRAARPVGRDPAPGTRSTCTPRTCASTTRGGSTGSIPRRTSGRRSSSTTSSRSPTRNTAGPVRPTGTGRACARSGGTPPPSW